MEQILKGAQHGWEFYDGQDDNKVAKAGGDWPDITFHQILLIYGTMGALNELAGVFNRSIPLAARVAACALPPLLWKAQGYTEEHPKSLASHVVFFLHERLGDACLAVGIASSLAQVGLGNRLMGSVALGITLFASGEKHIPHAVRFPARLTVQFFAIAAAIRYGNYLDKGMGLAKGALIASIWIPRAKPSTIAGTDVNVSKPFDEGTLQVDHRHVEAYRTVGVPPPPEVKFQGLVEMFDGITWADHQKTLENVVGDDEEWKKRPSKDTTEMLPFAKEGIVAFVASLEKKVVKKGGDLRDFQLLQDKAKHVLSALQGKKNLQARYLVRLGVWAGHHCATAYTREVNKAYSELCSQPLPGLREEIGAVLADRRDFVFRQALGSRNNELHTWLQAFLDPRWDHNYNQFVQLFGNRVGHPLLEQAGEDFHAVGHLEQKVILYGLYRNHFAPFWKAYNNVGELINVVEGGTQATDNKSAVIKSQHIEDWLRSFYKGEQFDQWKADEVYDEDGFIKRKYVVLILVNLGFLTPAPNQTHP